MVSTFTERFKSDTAEILSERDTEGKSFVSKNPTPVGRWARGVVLPFEKGQGARSEERRRVLILLAGIYRCVAEIKRCLVNHHPDERELVRALRALGQLGDLWGELAQFAPVSVEPPSKPK